MKKHLLLATTLALIVAAPAIAKVKSGTWKGPTSQTGEPAGTVNFKVSRNHKTVKAFAGDIYGVCTKGASTQTIHITLNPVGIDFKLKHKKFSFHSNFTLTDNGVVIARQVDGKINGKFAGSTAAAGTMSFSWKFDNKSPIEKGYSCATGVANWTATH